MSTPDAAAAPPPRRFPRIRTVLLLVVFGTLAVLSIYTWLALHWDYSNGYRSGILQKFSQKGWLCKTDEGELLQYTTMTNLPQNIWYFTVRDHSVKLALDTLVGRNVRLHYTEHRGVPTSCFGDTNYYVDGVTVIKE
ncbi:MAG TPA: hypothetical protein VG692_04385 [Gemmatimonadales bacterium]|nr:hypothetical protein [Gemmatimonadales bacterium]